MYVDLELALNQYSGSEQNKKEQFKKHTSSFISGLGEDYVARMQKFALEKNKKECLSFLSRLNTMSHALGSNMLHDATEVTSVQIELDEFAGMNMVLEILDEVIRTVKKING